TAQVRALDAHAIEELGIAGYTLMKRAGEAALRYLRTRWPMAHRIVIVCGRGNNAGDGYVLARFAQAAGLTVTVLSAAPPEELRADARRAYEDFRASGGVEHPFSAERLTSGEVIVDALLGTGLEGDVRGLRGGRRLGAARLGRAAHVGGGDRGGAVGGGARGGRAAGAREGDWRDQLGREAGVGALCARGAGRRRRRAARVDRANHLR